MKRTARWLSLQVIILGINFVNLGGGGELRFVII
jgi:hypothetical protein